MRICLPRSLTALLVAIALFAPCLTLTAQRRSADGSRDARLQAPPALALQVALDVAGFSPGEIDGRSGASTERALVAFRAARGLPATAGIDDATKQALGDAFQQPLAEYEVTEQDLSGPFIDSVPADMMAQAALEQLAYTSAWEMLGERFHAAPKLLQTLNGNIALAAGVRLRVPAVKPMEPPAASGNRKLRRAPADTATRKESPDTAAVLAAQSGAVAGDADVHIEVSEADQTLTVRDAGDRVIFFAPVTVGGPHDPLPVGSWKVTAVYDRPVFNYNPELFWDANPAHAKATIKPGPNSPVGLVWVDIDKENFGLHGTPEPSRIGRTQSHGCVRMTNWDALTVASLVRQGTPVVLR